MWGVIDIVSAGSCEMAKRYGVIYVDGDNLGNGTYKRYKKDSFKWYHDYIQAQHQQFKKWLISFLFSKQYFKFFNKKMKFYVFGCCKTGKAAL